MSEKPHWRLVGVSTDGWYQFTNLRAHGVRSEGYMIHRDNFWNLPSRCWDCGQRSGQHHESCSAPWWPTASPEAA